MWYAVNKVMGVKQDWRKVLSRHKGRAALAKCCSGLMWGLVILAQPLLPISHRLHCVRQVLKEQPTAHGLSRGMLSKVCRQLGLVLAPRWAMGWRCFWARRCNVQLRSTPMLSSCWLLACSNVVPALHSCWCWCSGQQPCLSPSTEGKPKHIFLHCCLSLQK